MYASSLYPSVDERNIVSNPFATRLAVLIVSRPNSTIGALFSFNALVRSFILCFDSSNASFVILPAN